MHPPQAAINDTVRISSGHAAARLNNNANLNNRTLRRVGD
jgi:hypothetical protein